MAVPGGSRQRHRSRPGQSASSQLESAPRQFVGFNAPRSFDLNAKRHLRYTLAAADGYQLFPYTLGGLAIAVIVINVDRVAQGFDLFADFLRTDAGHIDCLW